MSTTSFERRTCRSFLLRPLDADVASIDLIERRDPHPDDRIDSYLRIDLHGSLPCTQPEVFVDLAFTRSSRTTIVLVPLTTSVHPATLEAPQPVESSDRPFQDTIEIPL